MTKMVSVIIPCYNNELYIGPCLDSILKQTYNNLEILVVDDGSTDNSYKICREYAQKDGRIKCFWQENSRVGAARNKGLDNASGDYVMFMDSDDVIEPDTVERALKILEEKDADIVQWETCFFKNDVNDPYYIGEKQEYEYAEVVTDGQGAVEILLDSKGRGADSRFCNLRNGTRCVWNKLIKAKLFDNLRFPIDFEYEDDFIVSDLYMASEKIVFFNQQFTHKRDHEQSVLHLMKLKGGFDKLECEYKRLKLVEKWNKPSVMRLACHAFFISGMNLGLLCSKHKDSESLETLTKRIRTEYEKYKNYMSCTDRTAIFAFVYFQSLFIRVYTKYRTIK